MSVSHTKKIAAEMNIPAERVAATVALLDDEATVPFIARYRKEATGGLDEVAITTIRDRITRLRELDKRRQAIVKALEERGQLTDELRAKLDEAETMAVLEDIYLPFRPKKRTRATIAVERGLEPLAEIVFEQDDIDPAIEAEKFIDPEKDVNTVEEALAGAGDIIASWINEDAEARAGIRELFRQKSRIHSRVVSGQETGGAKYADYFDWEEDLKSVPSHRILAMYRGETEEVLSLSISPPLDEAMAILEKMFIIGDNRATELVRTAISDGYKRLMAPSMENEIRQEIKRDADETAIDIFADNLRELLMDPPLGQKRVMAIDPGFRTGCKLVCLSAQGDLLHYTTIFPHGGEGGQKAAAAEVKALCDKYKTQVIAIGSGTAGRETEAFVRGLGLPKHILIVMVNESGASVYSVSKTAREEFPDCDATVRGAVSIGRRLMDPLSELVKIDPKSIGVGQYQHDVDQKSLKQGLDDTVVSCVNAVGVEVNTASRSLMNYVSGLGPQLAQNIIKYREEKGPFRSRQGLKKVPRLGPRAFQQAAGFLRIIDAENPLDRSAVHPESYPIVRRMAADLGCTVGDLTADPKLREKIDLEKYATDTVGLPTLLDIMEELAKPGRDPRRDFVPFSYDSAVNTIEDLQPGMNLPGIVTNVTAFGAFVDIGVHNDGLVHISELADKFVRDPAEIVRVHQRVRVTVLEVDLERKRIALSMRQNRPEDREIN